MNSLYKNRILILEAQADIAPLLVNTLPENGFEVLTAKSVEEIINLDLLNLPGLILLNERINEPNGKLSCSLLKSNRRTKNIPIIFLLSESDISERSSIFAAGAIDYILKPVQPDELLTKIKTYRELVGFQKVIEASPIAMVVNNTINNTSQYNKKFTELFGYDWEDVPTVDDWFPLAYPDETFRNEISKKWYDSIEEYLQSKGKFRPIEARVTCKDGSYRDIEFSFESIGEVHITTFVDLSEHKKTEQALRESEEMFRNLIDNMPMVCFRYDANGKILSWNHEAEIVYGYTEKEAVDRSAYDLIVSPQTLDATKSVINAVFTGQIIKNAEWQDHNKQKELGWRIGNTFPLLRADGTILCGVNLTIDNSLRKKAENELLERNRFIESLINLNPGILYIYDLIENKNIYINEGIQKILGYSTEEIQNSSIQLLSSLMHTDDFKAYTEKIIPCYSKANDNELISHQYRMKHKNGSWHWLESTECIYKRKLDKSPEQIFGVIQDITERKRAEVELRESEEKLKAVINNSAAVIYVKDLFGRYTLINSEWARLFHVTPEEMIGKTDHDFFPPEFADGFAKNDIKVRTEKEQIITEEIAEVDGNVRNYISIKFPLFDDKNNIFATGGISTDITEQKKVEKELEQHRNKLEDLVAERTMELRDTIARLKETQTQLIQSEKMASMGVLTAGIAHEINNPVGYINSSIVALADQTNDLIHFVRLYESINTENIKEKLEEIQNVKKTFDIEETTSAIHLLSENILMGAKRTADIVKSLRIFSRTDDDYLGLLNINENINSTLVLLHNQYKDHIEIVKEFQDIPQIECYAGKLNQVFMNILVNAIQAISTKGTITIQTRHLSKGCNAIEKECILVSIIDSGEGIPNEIQNKIFEPFFTTKAVGKGTGLGLSISYGIIEKHNGKIEVSTEIGKGTEFRIYLPVKQDK